MKFIYKGCTYRTENLTDADKELMKKEIAKAEEKQNRFNEVLKKEPEKVLEPEKGKKYKSLED